MVRGVVDLLENGKIFGWAYSPDSPDEHLKVAIRRGDKVIAEGMADVFRPDLPRAGIGSGHHAFEISIPPDVTSFRGLTIAAEPQAGGSVVLPIETEQDRKVNQALAAHARRYEDALSRVIGAVDESRTKSSALEEDVATRLSDLAKRVDEWEARIEGNEVFLVRIDEKLTALSNELAKRKRKRFLGIF